MRVYFETEKVSEAEYRKAVWRLLAVGIGIVLVVWLSI
jgi:hypothetical protein